MLLLLLLLHALILACAPTSSLGVGATNSAKGNARYRYRPLVLVHGINNRARTWDKFAGYVRGARGPAQAVFPLVSPFDGVPGSWVALRHQVAWFEREIAGLVRRNKREFEAGYDLVCHSQGAVICRALVHETDHGVASFVSLAGPQMGVFGDGWIAFFPPGLRNLTIHDAYEVAYQPWAQATLSPANLWHDPFHEKEYLQANAFFRELQGLSGDARPADVARRKRNFVRLERACFLVGNLTSRGTTFDKGIDPWFSGIFGFYDSTGRAVVDARAQPVYKRDTFGLRSLDAAGRLTLRAVPGVLHDDWLYDEAVVTTHVLPCLSGAVRRLGLDGDDFAGYSSVVS